MRYNSGKHVLVSALLILLSSCAMRPRTQKRLVYQGAKEFSVTDLSILPKGSDSVELSFSVYNHDSCRLFFPKRIEAHYVGNGECNIDDIKGGGLFAILLGIKTNNTAAYTIILDAKVSKINIYYMVDCFNNDSPNNIPYGCNVYDWRELRKKFSIYVD